jgi:hypothetical protein
MLDKNPNSPPDLPRTVTPELLKRPLNELSNCVQVPFDLNAPLPFETLRFVRPAEEPKEESDHYTAKDIRRQVYAVAALLGTIMYWSDVAENITEESKAEPSIKVVAQAQNPENEDRVVIIEDGFNTVNANYLSKTLAPAIQHAVDGEVWSVQSNNAPMNVDTLLYKVLDLAESRDIKSISIATYSMGNMRGTSLAEKIVKESDIPVENIVIMSGPSGYDSLRESRKEEMAWAKVIAQLVPGSAHSTFWRAVAELWFYKDAFTKPEANPWESVTKNVPRFFDVLKGIQIRFRQPHTSNASLLMQMDALNGNPVGKIEALGAYEHEHDKQLTNITYVSSSAYDAMLDDTIANDDFQRGAEKGGLPFNSYEVEGVYHGNYYVKDAVPAYDTTFKEASKEIITQTQLARATKELRNYEAYTIDTFLVDSRKNPDQ